MLWRLCWLRRAGLAAFVAMLLVLGAAAVTSNVWCTIAMLTLGLAGIVLFRIARDDFPIPFPAVARERALEIERLAETALVTGRLGRPYDGGEDDRRNTHTSYVDEAVGYEMERFNRHEM